MNEKQRDARNLKPHKAAVAAMFLFSNRYAGQTGGSMDFWDTLAESNKRLCRDLVDGIAVAPAETRSVRGGMDAS